MEQLTPAFEQVLKGLEEKREALTERRRGYTKNLVTQTNDEARSGMPYVVDVALVIARANSAELFIDSLVNDLRSHSRTIGEASALKRALSSVIEQLRETGNLTSGSPEAADLYDVGRYLMGSVSAVVLREEQG